MQYFVFFIINVFILAVFYLIFSLKLERNASEFREKKLKKVMDEIMTEFNSSAERNISILEKKIDVMKRLLERAGDLKSIDISLESDDSIKSVSTGILHKDNKIEMRKDVTKSFINEMPVEKIRMNNNLTTVKQSKKSLKYQTKKVINNIIEKVRKALVINQDSGSGEEEKNFIDKTEIIPPGIGKNIDFVIKKDIDELKKNLDITTSNEMIETEIKEDSEKFNEDKIKEMFCSSEDKYTLIVDLHKKGHEIEEISKFSGIPISEVRLVLNLNI